MKELIIHSVRKLIQNIDILKEKLKVNILVKGTKIEISGNEVDEYFAERVLIALDYPFEIDQAILLLNEDILFNVINIKAHTRRHDYNVIKGRIIGKG